MCSYFIDLDHSMAGGFVSLKYFNNASICAREMRPRTNAPPPATTASPPASAITNDVVSSGQRSIAPKCSERLILFGFGHIVLYKYYIIYNTVYNKLVLVFDCLTLET